MKQFVIALVVIITGYSLNAADWFGHAAPAPTPTAKASADPFESEAAIRHRFCQPKHWRAMVMQK